MKKEQFFSLIGELDDRFLERYRQMDMRLSYKAMRKKRTLRVLAVAACLCLLIGACVPVGMLIAQLMKSPATPPPTIYLQGLDELEIMREMVECEDEQMLMEYLHSITGGGAQSRQDLIEFLSLVDNTPYAQIIDGEMTGLTYNSTDERFSVSAEAKNGDSLNVSYEFSVTDVEKNMKKAAEKLGEKNLLSAPLSTQNGRLTLYTEIRESSSNGEVIRWQGVLDGIAVYIVFWVADADAVDTAALLVTLKIADAIAPKPQTESETTEPVTTEPGTTEPSWDINRVPKLVKVRYLNIGVRDQSGEVTPLLSAEELENFDDYLELEYVKGGELIIECYAAYNRSGEVGYECSAGTAEQIAFSDIDTDVTVDVQADYIHFLRFTIPLDVIPFGQRYVELIGHATGAPQLEGWAMMEYFKLQLNEPVVSPPVIEPPHYDPPTGDDTTDDSEPAAIPQLIEMGYLAVCARDENGETRRLLDTQELNGFTGELTAQYLLGEELIIDLYVALEDSDQVSFTCDKGRVRIVDFSEIDTDVAVNVQADYVECLRLTVPMSELTRGTNYVVVYGNATRVQIDGWVLLETIKVNIS